MLGTIQAAEVLKYLTGVGDLLTNRLLSFNAKTMNFRNVNLKPNPKCPVCSANATIKTLVDYEQAVCDLKH